MAIKLLQAGDYHLDSPYSSKQMDLEKANQRRQDLRNAFRKTVDLALSEDVQLVLLTGDLFEHRYGSRKTMQFIAEELDRLTGIPVFILPGNHDPAVVDSFYRSFPWPHHVRIFTHGCMQRFELPYLGVDIHGWGWDRWDIRQPQLFDYTAPDPKRMNIFMFHGQIGVTEGPYFPVPFADLKAMGADYTAMGHIHQSQQFEDRGRIIAQYTGSPEPLNFGEPGEHGVMVGEVDKDGSAWHWFPIASRRYHSQMMDAEVYDNTRSLINALAQTFGSDPYLLLRILIQGNRQPGAEFDTGYITDQLADGFFHVEIDDMSVSSYDTELLIKEYPDSLVSAFVREVNAKSQAASESEAFFWQKVMSVGLNALLGRR